MRWLGPLVACVAALATAACDPMSDQYFSEGAGFDLNSGQLAQATQLQDEYVYYICRQAGGSNLETAAGPSCSGASWTAFTEAGMNDIDQRCDAYLAWLDAQRRDRTPVLSQIAAMGAATGGIMGVTGVGTHAIAIVAMAFGLAGTTYANWNSRLLLDVDHSTVQIVVYTRQQQYRKANAGVIVLDRAAAIYLLRGYLRICMPITIETDINTTVTLVQSGAPQAVAQSPLLRSIPTAPFTPRMPVAVGERPIGTKNPNFSLILDPYKPNVDTVENLHAPLRALCATEDQVNDITRNLRAFHHLIRLYQFSITYQSRDSSLRPEVTGKLTPAQITRLRISPCNLTENAANYYEFRFIPKGIGTYVDALNKALDKLKNALPNEPPLDSAADVQVIRERIKKIRDAIQASDPNKLPSNDLGVDGQVTPDLDDYLIALPR
jgi:hypothetical protein